MAKITIEQIQMGLLPDNWKILSTEYKNLDSELIFECSNGHKVRSTWKQIRKKRECPICEQEKQKLPSLSVIQERNKGRRLLALDQATHLTGWAIFYNGQLSKCGVYKATGNTEIQRDNQLKNWLLEMIEQWKINIVAIEDTQPNEKHGINTTLTLARLQGILMSTLEENNIEYIVCNINKWRAHSGVKGKNRKEQKASMQAIVKKQYGIDVTDDCADAIGIGRYAVYQDSTELKSWE